MNSSSSTGPQALATFTAGQAIDFLEELANLRPERAACDRLRTRFTQFIPERQPPFAAVETRPYRDRQRERGSDGTAPPAPSEDVRKVAEALRTGKYRGAAASTAMHAASSATSKAETNFNADRERPLPRLGPLRSIDPSEQEVNWIWTLREQLRRVWDQPDQRTREWGVFLLLLTTRGEAGSRHVTLLGFPGPLPPPTPFELALLHFVKTADRARHCQNPDCVAPYFFAKRRSQKYCSEVCALPAQRAFKRQWWAEHGSTRRQGTARKSRQSSKKGRYLRR